jgi:hypothetical protein
MSTYTTPVNSIKYFTVNDAGEQGFIITPYQVALKKGAEFTADGYRYTVAPLSELAYYMHKHAPRLDVKMHSTFRKTIAEMYDFDYNMLYDLLLLKGGKIYLGQLIAGVEELYNQEQQLEQWERNQM